MSFFMPKQQSAPAPAPPTLTDTDGAQQDYADMLRKRQGRAAAILTGPQGAGTPTTATKTLLGS